MTQVSARLAETLRTIQESQAVDLHTALPGIVRSYDAATQTADIQPAIQRIIPAIDDDNEDEAESLPVLRSVPISWPRAGGFFLHFPLAEGDSVLLVFCEQDTNAWRNTGDEVDPGTPERHGLSGAVAIPGYFPRSATIGDASGDYGRIGRDGGPYVEFRPSEIQAGGSETLAKSKALDALFSAISSAAVSPNDGGATFKANLILALNADPDWLDGATSTLKGG